MKIVAKVLLVDVKEDLLLLSRGLTHPNFPGHFDLPGGEVEEGEDWEVAVAREVVEEAGIQISGSELIKVFEIERTELIHVLYIGKIDTIKPKVVLSWEHSNFQWIPLKDLIELPLPKSADKYYVDVVKHIALHPEVTKVKPS